jgi:hypothetical protein
MNAVRFTLLVLLSCVLGAALYVELLVATGAGECDRADCSWFVDLFDGTEAGIALGASILIAAGVVFGVAYLVGRALRRPARRVG